MVNNLRILGIAKKAGRLEIGEETVGASARAKKARVILSASDASPNLKRQADNFAFIGNTLHLNLPYTKYELGIEVGRGLAGILAITDYGIASSFIAKLAAVDPEHYGEASEFLAGKAEKALQRKREAIAHEKNSRIGKRRTK